MLNGQGSNEEGNKEGREKRRKGGRNKRDREESQDSEALIMREVWHIRPIKKIFDLTSII